MKATKSLPSRVALRIAVLCCAGLLTLTFALMNVEAIAGGLDPSFGGTGKVLTHISNSYDHGNAVALQSDGKIIVAGMANNSDFAVVRYNTNGSLDTTFDTDGIVTTDFGGTQDTAQALAIQSDGKIVVAGYSNINFNGSNKFAVARYNTNGSLDLSFDTDGKVITDISNNDEAYAVAIQSDGKIVVAGYSAINLFDFLLVRYNTDGSLDTTFDTDGKVLTDFGEYDMCNGMAIQSDGRIVAAGRGRAPGVGQPTTFALARYNTDGSLDTSFDTDGKVYTSIHNNFDIALAVAVQSDGKIVAGGYTNNWQFNFVLVRYNPDGSLDTGFGVGGKVETPFGDTYHSFIRDIAILSNGKIVAAGSANVTTDFAVARYRSNGLLDTSFGMGGKVTTAMGASSDYINGVAVQSDGRIVAAGTATLGGNDRDIALVRYNGDASYTGSHRFDFDGDSKSDVSVYRPSSSFWYIWNSSTNTLGYQQFGGLPQDKLVPADYDGNGKTDFAIFRDGGWHIYNSQETYFGQAGDVPVPGDYDGDTRADLAIFHEGLWHIKQSSNGSVISFLFGISADKAVPADYDGDGKFDAAIYRDGVWYIQRSTEGFTGVQFGASTDRPVPADYDGDGKCDVAVYRDGDWYILGSSAGFSAVRFGISTDDPVAADYDGDGKADVAVYRDGTWYFLYSSNGAFAAQNFGASGDVAIPSVYEP